MKVQIYIVYVMVLFPECIKNVKIFNTQTIVRKADV